MASGKNDNRPGLTACLKALRAGGILIVWDLDRLGRNLRDLVNIVYKLEERDIGIKVLTGRGVNIDTTSANGKLIFGIFAALAEYERLHIVRRTKAGLTAARARGRIGGRPPKMTKAKLLLAQGAISNPNSSMGQSLEVDFVENNESTSVNPNFPRIYLKAMAVHNAWVQVVRTDALQESLKMFIDTTQELTPFYSYKEDFYDAPLWQYGFFYKPLTFWRAYTYAVKVDHISKTVICVGGVAWGFKLGYSHFFPIMIPPTALSLEDWQRDWLLIKNSLMGYVSL